MILLLFPQVVLLFCCSFFFSGHQGPPFFRFIWTICRFQCRISSWVCSFFFLFDVVADVVVAIVGCPLWAKSFLVSELFAGLSSWPPAFFYHYHLLGLICKYMQDSLEAFPIEELWAIPPADLTDVTSSTLQYTFIWAADTSPFNFNGTMLTVNFILLVPLYAEAKIILC